MFKRKIITTSGALFSSSLLFAAAVHATTTQYKGQQALHDIANAVSKTRIEQDIQTLVDFGTRHTFPPFSCLSDCSRTIIVAKSFNLLHGRH